MAFLASLFSARCRLDSVRLLIYSAPSLTGLCPPFNTFVLFYKSKSGHIQTRVNSLLLGAAEDKECSVVQQHLAQVLQCCPGINCTSGDVNKPNFFLLLKFWRQKVWIMFHFVKTLPRILWLCVLHATNAFQKHRATKTYFKWSVVL